jgi:hypothetical protein
VNQQNHKEFFLFIWEKDLEKKKKKKIEGRRIKKNG